MASESGMTIEQSWRDHENLFSLSLLRPG
ncbi:MAG: L-histidine N(alpha)-methyltransferase [Chloroflexi bacterium]|nr:L-histidine N(alpha)-methyltransferase [Chloroflexota bacterium]